MSEVLGHQIDLLRTLRLEPLCLTYQPGERLGAVLAAHQRNGAEGAGVVAALGDLEVAHVRRVAQELADARMAREGVVDQPALGERRHQVMEVGESEKQIDLRDLLLELLLVSLDETSDRDDRLHVALSLEPCG